jgi:RHS repeat-associated protein
VIKGCLELFNIMNIIGRSTSDTLKSLQFNTMTLEQAYPVGGGVLGEEMPQIGEDPGGYPSQARILYWYHPDYIQNVDLVTDLDGEAYELFLYNPWGEQLHHWSSNSSSWTSPYRFNAKEQDPETGLAYYGARYYQNKIGVWLSVDPMAHFAPGWSPFRGFFNNPLLYNDPKGLFENLDWVEKADGTIYWDDNATSQATTKEGETYLGRNVLVGTHNRDEKGNEPINSAQFDLYLESNKEGPSATIMGNTVPADIKKAGTLAEGLYSAKFGHRNAEKYKNELAIRIYNLDGTDGLPTINGNPNPRSNGKTLTGVLFHMGNNYQTSLFDSNGNAYSNGCQTSGNYPNSRPAHNEFMKKVGTGFNGAYYLRSRPK